MSHRAGIAPGDGAPREICRTSEQLPIGNQQHIKSYDIPDRARFDAARFDRPDLGIDVRPSFLIDPDDRIFVIGSCFAREIDTVLTCAGFHVGGGSVGNKYNNFSMLQSLAWTLGAATFHEGLIAEMNDNQWFDGHRHPVEYHASPIVAVQSHREALDRVRGALNDADVIIITLGLVEAWRDKAADAWLNCTPPKNVCDYVNRYECVRTTHGQNLDALLRIFELLNDHKPRRIVCSVSPVPLFATFTDDDVLVANAYSKATLRSVVSEAIADANERGASIDYFPSYELATLAPRESVWREQHANGDSDGRHVRPEFVRDVILPAFMNRYISECPIAVGK